MIKLNVKHKIWPAIRKVGATVSISAGLLAVANVETIWQEYHRIDHQEKNRFLTKSEDKPKPRAHVKEASGDEKKVNYKPLQSALSQSLEEDEILDANPFAHLSTLEPLQKIMQKGVAHFKRETFRSADFHDESGYDMLSYDIEHNDGSKSGVIAYLEKAEGSGANTSSVFVVFMVGDGTNSALSFFRGGQLLEQSQLSTAEVQTLVAHKLSQGIPFLSVSR